MTLNLRTLLLTMMMFKWGKNSCRVACLCAGMPTKAAKKLLNFILVAYLNVFIYLCSPVCKERTRIKIAMMSYIFHIINS